MVDGQPKQRGGWREAARGKVGRKPQPAKSRLLALRVPPELRAWYETAAPATKKLARQAMIAALAECFRIDKVSDKVTPGVTPHEAPETGQAKHRTVVR